MAQWTTTYTSLVSLLMTFTEDDTAEFSSAVAGCINRAEDRILRDLDLSLFNVATSTSTTSGQSTTLRPNPKSPIKSIYLPSLGVHASRRTRDYLQAYGGSGAPVYFCEDDADIVWAPTPDTAYEVVIVEALDVAPLSPTNVTNWISDNVADLLLKAALVESEKFLIAPERAQEFEQDYARLLGPLRAKYRSSMQTDYEPVSPTPTPTPTR